MNRRDLLALGLSGWLARPCDAADQYFDSAGVRIRFVERGRGEPVVLIHAFAADLDRNWVTGFPDASGKPQVLEALAERHRVLALDLRGHGKSDKPHARDEYGYGVPIYQDVLRLLDHLKIDRAHLVGYSAGANIAGILALHHPDRIRSAVLWAGAPQPISFIPHAADVVIHEGSDSLIQGTPLERLLRSAIPSIPPRPIAERIAVLDTAPLPGEDRKALGYFLGAAHLLAAAEDRRFRSNPVPMLAVVGTGDPVRREVNRIRGRLANLQVVEIGGADHLSCLTDARSLVAIQRFLMAQPIRETSS